MSLCHFSTAFEKTVEKWQVLVRNMPKNILRTVFMTKTLHHYRILSEDLFIVFLTIERFASFCFDYLIRGNSKSRLNRVEEEIRSGWGIYCYSGLLKTRKTEMSWVSWGNLMHSARDFVWKQRKSWRIFSVYNRFITFCSTFAYCFRIEQYLLWHTLQYLSFLPKFCALLMFCWANYFYHN